MIYYKLFISCFEYWSVPGRGPPAAARVPGTRPPGPPRARPIRPQPPAHPPGPPRARSGNESARSSSSSFRCLKVRHFYVCASSASNEAQVRHQKEGSHAPSHQATKPPSHQATIQKCSRMF